MEFFFEEGCDCERLRQIGVNIACEIYLKD